MLKNGWSAMLFAGAFFVSVSAVRPDDRPDGHSGRPLHIDIPAKVDEANVVFNIDRLALNGDMPVALGHLGLLADDFSALNAHGRIVAVFHTDAGHVTLTDAAYNAERQVTTGNPYKGLLAELMKKGVQIELCGATAKAHRWNNTDFLEGVKVNVDAMVRLAQLGQEGYVQIKE